MGRPAAAGVRVEGMAPEIGVSACQRLAGHAEGLFVVMAGQRDPSLTDR